MSEENSNGFIEGLINSQMRDSEKTNKENKSMSTKSKREILKEIYCTFREIDISEYAEEKPGGKEKDPVTGKEREKKLKYLNWAWAQELLMRNYPDAIVKKFFFDKDGNECENGGNPYFIDSSGFVWVKTSITIEEHTITQFLPVYNEFGAAQKTTTYTIKGKYGDRYVKAADAMDVNTAIQRCFVKNLSMWGLGADLYEGIADERPSLDDIQGTELVEQEEPQQVAKEETTVAQKQASIAEVLDDKAVCQIAEIAARHNMTEQDMCKAIGANSYKELTTEHYSNFLQIGKAHFFDKWDEEHKASTEAASEEKIDELPA